MKTKKKPLVPKELLIPLGQWATTEFKKCADNWSDSEMAEIRARLDTKYHAVPLDALRRLFINLRKNKTPGFKVNGHGAAKGSRRKSTRKKPPKWYQDYLDSDKWKLTREKLLKLWGHACAICNCTKEKSVLDVHHRTYERLGNEQPTDCIIVCRSCHNLIHDHVKIGGAK